VPRTARYAASSLLIQEIYSQRFSPPPSKTELYDTILAILYLAAEAKRVARFGGYAMKVEEFVVGEDFWCGDQRYRCTDIGTRTIVAIRVDSVEVAGNTPERRRTLSHNEAEAEGWFNGPPYAVAEHVFDEYEQEGCSRSRED
jgi:hypothetical protein